jgi:hypothetical protein
LAALVAIPAAAAPQETVLHRFRGELRGGDGAFPYAGLIMDANGALYGTAVFGGDPVRCRYGGCGTAFKLMPPGSGETLWKGRLYRFNGRDGANPQSGLIIDANGVLYGTSLGGNPVCGAAGCGTAFALVPPTAGDLWTETLLYGSGAAYIRVAR